MRHLFLLALAACGRIDFDARVIDAGEAKPDAACFGTGAFTNVQPVTALDDSTPQYGTSLTPDGLVLLWDQSNGTFDQLYMTQRASRADPFPAGALIPGMFVAANASHPSLTADLRELYFASDVGAGLCIYRATRATPALPFDPSVKLGALCNGTTTSGPSISADGLTLVYNSALDALSEGDLYITVRSDRTADFPAGKKLNGLPTPVGDPWLSEDRLRIWFEEEIGPDLELVTAQRISPSDDFSGLQGLTELDTGTGNGDPALTADESEIVFSSSRTGNYDIYLASRPCL